VKPQQFRPQEFPLLRASGKRFYTKDICSDILLSNLKFNSKKVTFQKNNDISLIGTLVFFLSNSFNFA
jgi:hypothetical protein